MFSNIFLYGSSYLLGALHSLEPGHGKSLLALNASQEERNSQGLLMLLGLLVSHFSLVILMGLLFFNLPNEWKNLEMLPKLTSLIIIFYGIYLVRKGSRVNLNDSCECSSHTISSKNQNLSLGILAGLSPCPSVFAPIFISLRLTHPYTIFLNILSYMLGVVSVFLVLFFLLVKYRSYIQQFLKRFSGNLHPHYLSGILMIAIGVFYMTMSFLH